MRSDVSTIVQKGDKVEMSLSVYQELQGLARVHGEIDLPVLPVPSKPVPTEVKSVVEEPPAPLAHVPTHVPNVSSRLSNK